MVRMLLAITIATGLSVANADARGGGHYSGGHVSYGGGHHTSSHGGTYRGGYGASHRGGHYSNYRTGNRYGTHR